VPLAIWPAVRLKSFCSHAAKAALALKAPSVTAFDADVVAHASFCLDCGQFAAVFARPFPPLFLYLKFHPSWKD
jgi:hypothetical protein